MKVRRGLCWLFALVVLTAACGRKGAHPLLPADFESAPPAATLSPLTVRIYADAEYRRLGWRENIQSLMARANEVFARFGVALVVVDVVSWDRTSPIDDLQQMLEELQQLDPSPDVHFVVGLSAALPFATANREMLGCATLLRPYWVTRGLDVNAETKVVEPRVKNRKTLDRFVRARIRHLELGVFLHEWAHTLGVPHVRDSHSVMSPTYWLRQTRFGPEAERIIEISLRHLIHRTPVEERNKEILSFIRSRPDGDWDQAARDNLLGLLQSDPTLRRVAVTPKRSPKGDGRARFEEAKSLAGAGRLEEARTIAEEVFTGRPDDPKVAVFTCGLATKTTWTPVGYRACQRATALAPEDEASWVALARGATAGGDLTEANRAVGKVRALFDAAGKANERSWLVLAQLAAELDRISLSEHAASRAGDAGEAILSGAGATRRRLALPANAHAMRIGEADEPSYLAVMKRGSAALLAGDVAGLASTADEATRLFPDSAGERVLRCAVAAERGECARARPLCREALARDAQASLAHLEIGMCALREQRLEAAQSALRRAVDLSPEVRMTWKVLATVLDVRGKRREREELARRFRALHGDRL